MRKITTLMTMLLTLIFSTTALAAIPGINNSKYIRMYGLSTQNNTPVFTNARLNQRGTSDPFKAYNATIYADDEIWVFAMNDTFALISYPTSSGRRQGYVRTSDLTSNNYSRNSQKARRSITTVYSRPDVRYPNSSISVNDDVWTVARQGNYTQVVYPAGNVYKMAWITNSDYDNYIGNSPINHDPQGSVQVAESTSTNTLHVRGTAFDEDNPNGSIRLHVYVGGTPGSSVPQYEIRTNGSNRIFDDTRDIGSSKTGRQLVHVYALNDYGQGGTVEIWNGYVDIKSNTPTPITAKLQNLITKLDGQRWKDHSYSPSSIQCKEFASYIFNELYGIPSVGSGSTSSNYYNWRLNNTPSTIYKVAEVSETKNVSAAKAAFQQLFQQAQPGDFIQIKRGHGGPHSAIFVSRINNGIQWFDANADNNNGIKLQTYSYDDLVMIKKTKSGSTYQWNIAMSLYRAK